MTSIAVHGYSIGVEGPDGEVGMVASRRRLNIGGEVMEVAGVGSMGPAEVAAGQSIEFVLGLAIGRLA